MELAFHIITLIVTACVTGIIGYVGGFIKGQRKIAKAEHEAIVGLLISQILDDYDKYVRHGDEHTLTMARHMNIVRLADSYAVLEPEDETYKKYTDALISQTPEMVD